MQHCVQNPTMPTQLLLGMLGCGSRRHHSSNRQVSRYVHFHCQSCSNIVLNLCALGAECRAEHRVSGDGAKTLPSNLTLLNFLEVHLAACEDNAEEIESYIKRSLFQLRPLTSGLEWVVQVQPRAVQGVRREGGLRRVPPLREARLHRVQGHPPGHDQAGTLPPHGPGEWKTGGRGRGRRRRRRGGRR